MALSLPIGTCHHQEVQAIVLAKTIRQACDRPKTPDMKCGKNTMDVKNAPMRGGQDWPRAVIFDLDGTLIDSAPDLAGSLNAVLEADGLSAVTLEQVRLMIGNGVPKLIERGFAAQGRILPEADIAQRTPRFMEIYFARATQETVLYPGVMDCLRALTTRGVRIGLCTNKPTDVSTQILRDLGVANHFDAVVGGTSGYAKKPDPEPMLACLKDLGATPAQALYIGDSETDVKTARNAGIAMIAVADGYTATPVDELGADGHVATLEDIVGVIDDMRVCQAQ